LKETVTEKRAVGKDAPRVVSRTLTYPRKSRVEMYRSELEREREIDASRGTRK
jgi:hypothetical protein